MRTRNIYPAAIGAAVLLGTALAAAPAQAGGGGNFVEETGACTIGSTWVMKAKPAAGRIEMEFSVDSHRVGQKFAVRLTNQGALVFSGSRTTNGISKSFSVDKMLTDQAGTDRFVARATNAKTGEVCRGHVALAPGSGGNSG
jgi:hypothetical protein